MSRGKVEEVWDTSSIPSNYITTFLFGVYPGSRFLTKHHLLESVEQALTKIVGEVRDLLKGLANMLNQPIYIVIRKELKRWSRLLKGRRVTSLTTKFIYGQYHQPGVEEVYIAHPPVPEAEEFIDNLRHVIGRRLSEKLKYYIDEGVVEVYWR